MRKLLIAAAAAAFLAGPAAAQEPIFDEDMDARIARSIPPAAEVEAMAPVIDGMTGAMLDLDVGPIIDAADPYRRYSYRRGRTLRDIARRDDPYFDRRLRASIYGATADMARMMDAIAVAAPAMRRSLAQMEAGMARALRAPPPRHAPRYDPRDDPRDEEWEDEAPYDDRDED